MILGFPPQNRLCPGTMCRNTLIADTSFYVGKKYIYIYIYACIHTLTHIHTNTHIHMHRYIHVIQFIKETQLHVEDKESSLC